MLLNNGIKNLFFLSLSFVVPRPSCVIFLAHGNRVKFNPINKIVTPNSPSPAIDQCYDQGYGSERSPEDEVLPPLPQITDHYNTMVVSSLPQGLIHNTNQFFDIDYQQKFQQPSIQQSYDFITEGEHFTSKYI